MGHAVTGPAGLLRRRALLVVACLIAGGLLVGGVLLVRPVSYTSTASVIVTPTGVDEGAAPANGQGGRTGVVLETEAHLVESIAVTKRAADLLKSEPSLAASSVKIPTNTSILQISYKARTAGGAQRGAQAFATAYLDHRRAVAADSLAKQETSTQQQINSLRGQLQTTVKKLTTLSENSRDRAYVQAQADVLTSQIAALTDRLSTLQATTITPGRILVNAAVPPVPSGPSTAVLVLFGGLAVLVGTVVVTVLRDRTDRRLHTASATERRTRTPVLLNLAGVPTLGSGRATDEFRRAQSTLTAALPTGSRVVLVTPASADGSAALVATNLAGTLGRGGSTALLVRADPSSEPSGNGPGLAEVLAGDRTLESVLHRLPGTEAARVLNRGRAPLAVGLQSAAAGKLLSAARAHADWIVVETAPAPTSADAQTLARWSDAAVVVVDGGRTDDAEVRAAIEQLREVGLEQIGCALAPGWLRGGEPFIPAAMAGTRA